MSNQINSAGVIRLFDILGVGASSLCMVHCLLMPLIAGVLPVIGARYLDSPNVHHFLAAFVILFCLTAIIPGYLKHKCRPVLWLMVTGLALVLFATFASESLLGAFWELPLISLGNILVITAHAFNRKQHNCDHHLVETLSLNKQPSASEMTACIPRACLSAAVNLPVILANLKPVNLKPANLKPANLKSVQLKPQLALMLSVVPGLGQIYNGETIKGVLFLGVALANLAIVCPAAGLEPFVRAAGRLATLLFHCQAQANLDSTISLLHSTGSFTLVYLVLTLSFVFYVGRDAFKRASDESGGIVLPHFQVSMPEAASASFLLHFSAICTLVLLVMFAAVSQRPREVVTEIELVSPVVPVLKPSELTKPRQTALRQPAPHETELKRAELVEKLPLHMRPGNSSSSVEDTRTDRLAQNPPATGVVAPANTLEKSLPVPSAQSSEPAPAAAQASRSPAETVPIPASTAGDITSGDDQEFDLSAYLLEVQKRIKQSWVPAKGTESLSTTVKFRVLADGSLAAVNLVKSSGYSAADEAARNALAMAAPFPPLPGFAGNEIDIRFTFDYNVFSGTHPTN